MIIIALSAIWVSFICYLIWYVAVANHNVPITHEEAKTLSKIHKKPHTATATNGTPPTPKRQNR